MSVDKARELVNEQTAARLYRTRVREKARRALPYYSYNTFTEARKQSASVPEGMLLGRVALTDAKPDLNDRHDFYIGDRYLDLDGIEVFNWVAPVAATFFRSERADHEWVSEVSAVRTFQHRGDTIIDYADDYFVDDGPPTPFPSRALEAPGITSASKRALPGASSKPAQRPLPKPTVPPAAPKPEPTEAHDSKPVKTAPGHKRPVDTGPPLRAEGALRSQLAAPRKAVLSPILSTLQPDQYDLVTIPAMDSAVIEGKPGTGKTIVAAHRAAWMAMPPEEIGIENGLDGNILLIGPTDAYAQHVRGVVRELSQGQDNRVVVTSITSLLMQIAGLTKSPAGPASRTWQDVDTRLGQLANLAVQRFKRFEPSSPSASSVYEYLRHNGNSKGGAITRDPEWKDYLRELPPFSKACELRRHTALLALINWYIHALAKPSRFPKFVEHIMVDEAQDIHALEWLLLSQVNEADAWTILGDLNQRRSDHTLSSWTQVADVIAVPDGDPVVHRLERAYRSTRPILEYANRLLPRESRKVVAFQNDGPEPTVVKAKSDQMGVTLLKELERLLSAYSRGTVAIIDYDPHWSWRQLRQGGWATVGNSYTSWQKGGRQVTATAPDDARGLEFDAVIVVEPADFPQQFGREGLLYTSLTRPNRELAIIHSKPLPEVLEERKRRAKRAASPAQAPKARPVPRKTVSNGSTSPESRENTTSGTTRQAEPPVPTSATEAGRSRQADLKVGDRVQSGRFGVGRVVGFKGLGTQVDFGGRYGVKTIKELLQRL